jgi:hypothetical protein
MLKQILLVAIFGCAAESQVCDPIVTDSLGSQIWQAIQRACELRHPTEGERLSKLRDSIVDLANAKRDLIQTVQGVVAAQSIQGWLDARVKQIPSVQRRVKNLVLSVANESDAGGLLAGDPAVSSLRGRLNSKGSVLCRLDQISRQPFPLPAPVRSELTSLLASLQAEASALDTLASSLTNQIAQANGSQKQKAGSSSKN